MPKRKGDQENEPDAKRTHSTNTASGSKEHNIINSLEAVYDSEDPCRIPFDHVTNAIEKADYKDAIDTATSSLNDLIQKQMAMLNARAKAYGLANQIGLGIQDAEKMINLSPSAAAGYVRAGELYSMRCNYKHVLSIYKRGFSAVTGDNNRTFFKQQLQAAQAKLAQRIDIIGRVPHEILPTILGNLETRQLLKLLDVSQLWRARITEGCGAVWSKVEIHGPSDTEPTIKQWTQNELINISLVARHIVKLDLKYLTDYHLTEQVFAEIIQTNFSKVQKLTMHLCSIRDDSSLQFALGRLAGTLKELDINDYDDPKSFSPVPFKSILTLCRNLTRLNYTHWVTPSPASMGFLGRGMVASSLTNLVLRVEYIELEDVESILRFCPQLVVLSLGYCDRSIVRHINNICSQLEIVTLNTRQLYDIQFTEDSSPGLRDLNVDIENIDDLVPILTASRIDLQALFVEFEETGVHQLEALTSLQPMENVLQLTLVSMEDDDCQAAATLIRKLPTVLKVSILESNLDERRGVLFEALANVYRLYELDLTNVHSDGDSSGLVRVLQQCGVTKRPEDALNTVSFVQCNFIDDAVLEALSRITTLQSIEISEYSGDEPKITEHGFRLFCENLREHPSLETITLRRLPAAKGRAIRNLQTIRSLRELILDRVGTVTDQDLTGFGLDVIIDIHQSL